MTLPSDPMHAAAVRAAANLLADAAEQMPGKPVVVHITDGYHSVRVVIEQVAFGLADLADLAEEDRARQTRPSPEPAIPTHFLTPLDRHIMQHVPAQPSTMQRLARLCDHDCDSYFRSRVRRLVALELLRWDFRGYWREFR